MHVIYLLYAPVWLFLGWNLVKYSRRQRVLRRSWPGGVKPANCFQIAYAQGNAFQVLHELTQPGVKYAIVEENDEEPDDQDSGAPPDPAKALRRQARDICFRRKPGPLVVRAGTWREENEAE